MSDDAAPVAEAEAVTVEDPNASEIPAVVYDANGTTVSEEVPEAAAAPLAAATSADGAAPAAASAPAYTKKEKWTNLFEHLLRRFSQSDGAFRVPFFVLDNRRLRPISQSAAGF